MSYVQSSLLDAIAAKDAGIQTAVDHADRVEPGWSERAYKFLIEWLSKKPSGFKFQAEEVREAAKGVVPEPPSARSYGAIILRAKKYGHIVSIGMKPTKSPTAHRCFASVWVKTLN